MSTDTERREVAARLRSLDDERIAGKIALNGTWTFLDVLDETLFGERKFKMQHTRLGYITSRLADFIEPSEPEVKCVAEVKVDGERLEKLVHDAAVELTGIDRDALLALAEEMGGEKRDISCATCRDDFGLACYDYKPNATCMEACLRYYARRIRWALGVEDGS